MPIATTGIDRRLLGDLLEPGQPIKVKLRRGGDGQPVAASMEADTGSARSFRTVTSAVESLSGDRMQFRTSEGFVVPLDLAQVVGRKPTLKTDDGRAVMVDIGKSRGSVGDVRPGALVTVVGRSTGDRFAAELVQKD